jgi:hypothetical protein
MIDDRSSRAGYSLAHSVQAVHGRSARDLGGWRANKQPHKVLYGPCRPMEGKRR